MSVRNSLEFDKQKIPTTNLFARFKMALGDEVVYAGDPEEQVRQKTRTNHRGNESQMIHLFTLSLWRICSLTVNLSLRGINPNVKTSFNFHSQ